MTTYDKREPTVPQMLAVCLANPSRYVHRRVKSKASAGQLVRRLEELGTLKVEYRTEGAGAYVTAIYRP